MYNVAIVGVSGYTGLELVRLLEDHPHFKVIEVVGASQAGKPLNSFILNSNLTIKSLDEFWDTAPKIDLIFLALPHGESRAFYLQSVKNGISAKIIDLSSDFRFHSESNYNYWYKPKTQFSDDALEILGRKLEYQGFHYGLTDARNAATSNLKLVANPGCYATSILYAILPALPYLPDDALIVADAISGASGAGKGLSDRLHFSNQFENIVGYSLAAHRHTGEIEEYLARTKKVRLQMSAQLAPMSRGIHSIVSFDFARDDALSIYQKYYEGAKFVRVRESPPGTKEVRGSNYCLLHPHFDIRLNRLVVTSVIDNLVKGAAGQAIENANLMCSIPQDTGLLQQPMKP